MQTVSNLVNERFNLMTEKTRVRVERAMLDLAYHPNVAARTLRSARTRTLCFVLLDESSAFLADPMTDLVIAGIGDVTRDRDYGLLIRAARPETPDLSLLRPLLENRADGVFLFLSGDPELRRWYVEHTASLGFPFVLIESCDDPQVPSVSAADRDGARQLTEHLIAAGHERIAFATTAVPWPMLEQRLFGYRDALAEAGLTPIESSLGGWTPSSGAEHVEALLALPEPPTAVMCGNDLLAIGAVRMARRRGLRVPFDLAVTGFDDFDFAEWVDPALTSVRVSGYELGCRATELLIDLVEGRARTTRRVVIPVELRLRESG